MKILAFKPSLPSFFWALAFLCALFLIKPFEAMRVGAIGFLCCACVTAFWDGGPVRRHTHFYTLYAPVILLCVFMLASMIWSIEPFTSLTGSLLFAVFPLSLTLFTLSPSCENIRKQGGYALIFGIGGISVWILVQVFLWREWLVFGQPRHPLPNPNMLAALVSLGLFANLTLMIGTGAERLRPPLSMIHMAFNIAMTAALIATGSRAGQLAALGGLLLMTGIMPHKIWLHRRTFFTIFGTAFVTYALIILLPQTQTDVNAAQLMAETFTKTGSWQNRFDLWAASLELAQAHFPWGSGYSTFPRIYPGVRRASEDISAGLQAHNDPLQLAVELGLPGIFLFYTILIGVLVFTILRFRKADPARLIIPFCGLSAMAAHAHVSYPLYSLPNLFAASWLFSVWMGAAFKDGTKTAKAFPASNLNRFALIVFFGSLGTGFALLQTSAYLTRTAQSVLEQGDTDRFAWQINTANTLSASLNPNAHLIAATIPIGMMGFLDPSQTGQATQLYAQANSHLDTLDRVSQYHAGGLYYRGLLSQRARNLGIKTDHGPAFYFEKALSVNPLHLPSRQALFEMAVQTGDFEKAIVIAEEAHQWPYFVHSPEGFFDQASRLAAHMGRADLAQKFKEKARPAPKPQAGLFAGEDGAEAIFQSQ